MKVLVLGGTGAIGSCLVNTLSDRGFEVHVTSRKMHQNGDNVFYHIGDAKDFEFVKELMTCYEFDAIVDFMVYTIGEFQNRVDQMMSATEQYVFLSSARVYSNCENGKINENTPRLIDVIEDSTYLSNTSDYVIKKSTQENILFTCRNNNYTIIRPYISYSDYRLQLGAFEKEKWLIRAMLNNTIVVSEDILEHKTTMTYAKDVADRIACIICNPRSKGEIYNIASNKSCTWREILNQYITQIDSTLGYKPKVLALTDSEHLFKIADYRYAYIYDRLYDREFDCSKIDNIYGSNRYTDFSEGVNICLKHFFENPIFEDIPISWTAWCDRLCKEKTKLEYFKTKTRKIKYLVCRHTPYVDIKANRKINVL